MSARVILLVEDHAESRTSLAYVLKKRGFEVREAANGRAALAISKKEKLHAAILDIKLPDMDGLDLLRAIAAAHAGIPIIAVTGFATIDSAVEAMRGGASDFVPKPLQVDRILTVLERAFEDGGPVNVPRAEAIAEMAALGIIGYSRPMVELFHTIKRVAPYQSTVLVSGESGTGKELVARALHALGKRSEGPFVAVNCATLSEQILESELFGHEKGAFTGADQTKKGVMEVAHKGTLLLDEVNEMGLACQAKLLRALERREFRRVGGTGKIHVDLNLVAASNANLEECVARKTFRADLYFRLKVVTIAIPPLRERKEGIPVLAQRFLDDIANQAGLKPKKLSAEVIALLVRYPWPGNVRELRNCMESFTLMVPRAVIEVDDLPDNIRSARMDDIRFPVGVKIEDAEREIIRRTVEVAPTIREAAEMLGIGLRTLHTKLGKYGIRRPSDAPPAK